MVMISAQSDRTFKFFLTCGQIQKNGLKILNKKACLLAFMP